MTIILPHISITERSSKEGLQSTESLKELVKLTMSQQRKEIAYIDRASFMKPNVVLMTRSDKYQATSSELSHDKGVLEA